MKEALFLPSTTARELPACLTGQQTRPKIILAPSRVGAFFIGGQVTPGQVGNGEIKGGQAIYGRASYGVLSTRASYAFRLRVKATTQL